MKRSSLNSAESPLLFPFQTVFDCIKILSIAGDKVGTWEVGLKGTILSHVRESFNGLHGFQICLYSGSEMPSKNSVSLHFLVLLLWLEDLYPWGCPWHIQAYLLPVGSLIEKRACLSYKCCRKIIPLSLSLLNQSLWGGECDTLIGWTSVTYSTPIFRIVLSRAKNSLSPTRAL